MTVSSDFKMFYDLGAQWADNYHNELMKLMSDKPTFETKARTAFETSGFAENLSIRQYAFYMKNSERAEREFIQGAWDKLSNNGTEFELAKPH